MQVRDRITAWLCMVFVICATSIVWAEDIENLATLSMHMYYDDASNMVSSLKGGIKIEGTDSVGYGVNVSMDAITGATSSASSSKDEDSERFTISGRGIFDLNRENNLVLGAYASEESDYTGRSAFIAYTLQLNQQNTTLGLDISIADDNWKIAGLDKDYRMENNYALTAQQILSEDSHVQLSLSVVQSEGYLASPYRNTSVGFSTVNERLPDEREGKAIAIKYITGITDSSNLNLSYRFYSDDWDINSHTVDAKYFRDMTFRLVMGLRYRYYTQEAAYFMKSPAEYSISDQYIGVDYKYSDFDSHTIGINGMFRPGFDDYLIHGSLDYYMTSPNEHIENVYDQESLTAVIASLGLRYGF